MKPTHILSAAALLLPTTTLAGQQLPVPSPTAITDSFRGVASSFGTRLVVAFDSIPASRYGYAPTPAQQTVGYIAQHLVDANYSLCQRFDGHPRPVNPGDALADSVRARLPKDTLVKRLRESFAFCAAAIGNVDDAKLAGLVPVGPTGSVQPQQRARNMLLFVTDLAEHYAQLASYMRTMGLVPPSALNPVRRVAIDLPAASLGRYVGLYDVPASPQFGAPAIMLDIAMQDGALFVTPAGQASVQLWPASDSEFFLKVSPITLTFTRDPSGAVTGLVLHSPGEDRPGRKIR